MLSFVIFLFSSLLFSPFLPSKKKHSFVLFLIVSLSLLSFSLPSQLSDFNSLLFSCFSFQSHKIGSGRLVIDLPGKTICTVINTHHTDSHTQAPINCTHTHRILLLFLYQILMEMRVMPRQTITVHLVSLMNLSARITEIGI